MCEVDDECPGCSCHVAPPCDHCVEHTDEEGNPIEDLPDSEEEG